MTSKERAQGSVNTKTPSRYRAVRLFLYLVLLVLFMRFFLPWLVFRPSAEIAWTPKVLGLAYEDVRLRASDGVWVSGWFIPAENARATLLFLHGNGGNIGDCLDHIEILHGLGLSTLFIDYRGYGHSEGKPTFEGVTQDALAGWNWLLNEKKIPKDRLVVHGRSMGGAVAMDLMRYVQPQALILESTFYSLPGRARAEFLEPLALWVMGGDIWNSLSTARELKVPTLCIHSTEDRIVTYREGRKLYEALGGEKAFLDIKGGHNDGFSQSLPLYRQGVDAFLTRHFGRGKGSD